MSMHPLKGSPAQRNLQPDHPATPGRAELRNLSVLSYAITGFSLWHYGARALPLTTILADNYFADCVDMFQPADMILITAADGGCQALVRAPEAGGVRLVVMSEARL